MRTFQARLLINLFSEAISAANPARVLPQHLPHPRDCLGKIVVIGAGKASVKMAQCLEALWDVPLSGVVISTSVPSQLLQRNSSIQYLQSCHPIPEDVNFLNSEKLLEAVKNLSKKDWVICLISGGGSALLSSPLPGIKPSEKKAVYQYMLNCGASISEMNCVRRHISGVKGGRLAKLCYPAEVFTYVISDVPGDQLYDIASGPTVADPTTCAQALEIIQRYQIPLNETFLQRLKKGEVESITSDNPCLKKCHTVLIASPQLGLTASAQMARDLGHNTYILSDSIEGEARATGKVLAGITQQIVRYQQPWPAPCILLSGGETTVTLNNSAGQGGRNVEFLLSLGMSLPRNTQICALAADTDGIDGSLPIAGGVWYPDSLTRALHAKLDPQKYLDNHDAHKFFQALKDSLVTGETGTNINDFRAIMID